MSVEGIGTLSVSKLNKIKETETHSKFSSDWWSECRCETGKQPSTLANEILLDMMRREKGNKTEKPLDIIRIRIIVFLLDSGFFF